MKRLYTKILALLMFVMPMIPVGAMQQQVDLAVNQQVENLIPTPKSLAHAKKLTDTLKDYLAQLQEAATLLVLQHQRMEFTENFVNARARTVESRKKLENFQPCYLDASNFEAYNAAHPDNPINTPGFMITIQTPEAQVVYFRYKNLLTGVNIDTKHVPIILKLLQTENPEIKEYGRCLLSKLETTFYEREQILLDSNTQVQYEVPLVKYVSNHGIPSYLKKYLAYLEQTNSIQTEWYTASCQDHELYRFRAMLNAHRLQGDLDTSLKPQYQDQREYDHKASIKRLKLIEIYKLKLDEIRQLYRAVYQRLTQVCTMLRNRGISGQTLIQYKKNGATGQALPEDLTTVGLPKPRIFTDIVQNYKELEEPYSFIDDQLDTIVKNSKACQQNKKLIGHESTVVDISDMPSTLELAPSVAADIQEKEYQTTRYYVNEKNPLYIEIYDRQEKCTLILYRIVHPEDTLMGKPYVNFDYTERVTGWFTNPMSRLQEDGYTNPNHKYYTVAERYPEKIFIHTFSPLIDDYLFALGIETPSPYSQTDKNVRILGEIRRKNKLTNYVYFTYNFCQNSTSGWLCNHRCIEIQPKSEFLKTKLNQARWETNFPPLKK